MKRILFVFLSLFLFVSCYSVEIGEIIVTNDLCDELIEQFVIEDDPLYVPIDYGCQGYIEQNSQCLTECFQQDHCDAEHYCDYDTETCVLKGFGHCTSDNFCRRGLCLCDMCLDFTDVIFHDEG